MDIIFSSYHNSGVMHLSTARTRKRAGVGGMESEGIVVYSGRQACILAEFMGVGDGVCWGDSC